MQEGFFVEITASIKVRLGDKIIEFGILPSSEGYIIANQLLKEDHIPDAFCELTGFRRLDDHESRATISEAMHIGSMIVPLLFSMALGKPLLAICGRKHVLWLEKVLRKKYDFQVLRGSLSCDNEYEELEARDLVSYVDDSLTGQKDLHIIMISEKADAV